jgi:mRNA-degrading endonuclease RelE of RelBE toxin-antitoxin system
MKIEDLKKEIILCAEQKDISLKFSEEFVKIIGKIKDTNTKIRLYKQIQKIVDNPCIGKPMKYSRKGEQEVYLDSFRLYYKYYKEEKMLRFIEFSHKDEQ